MKIYLATPVNGRREKTLREKMKAAYERIQQMKDEVNGTILDPEYMSSFDINGVKWYMSGIAKEDDVPSESYIMGECVRMVMDADFVVMDSDWRRSKGCMLEEYVARMYSKNIKYLIDGDL